MSKRRVVSAAERRTRQRQVERRWWCELALELECATCLEAPPTCERCEKRDAVTVGQFVAHPVSGVHSLRGDHVHLCALCRDEVHHGSGAQRFELGDGR